ncbi:hypothetical protein CORC01_06142 [Colletotrichum orchidophilum]|uniref:Methyltransferase type 11 domain-containing protein n=1 Tax=Colletotrichum orchidophilum TaxID=1209926 RepID=A0A1G4BAT5_9PEZI|nr:uncharacterized protein CORC01_06142 [Colletotrichum orchidophilum]OHE98521.1 hypothetical protein CORC01_06142 [Colletotrichum orchidophilum]
MLRTQLHVRPQLLCSIMTDPSPSLSSSSPPETPLRPPSARIFWIVDNWPSILGGTVIVHYAHYQYLARFRRPNPNPLKNARFWALASGGWMLSYLSICTGIAVAQAKATTLQKDIAHHPPPTMSADFWAGYISGAVGIIIGNPLDVLKVRLQARPTAVSTPLPSSPLPSPTAVAAASYLRHFESPASLVTGSAAPILGYGALNALLFVSYNRTEAALNRALDVQPNLWTTWIAGAVGGLATWVVSTPTELIKCRAQLSSPPASSWAITKDVWRAEGIRGLYFGGVVTALRDSVGYGFYFWSYEITTRWMGVGGDGVQDTNLKEEAAKVLLCGGLAGIVTWVSIFPLDVIKTRVQTQAFQPPSAERSPLLAAQGSSQQPAKRAGAMQVAREAYREGGMRVFFRGLTVCSVRAFVVNAVQWAVYEWAMYEMGEGRRRPAAIEPAGQVIANAHTFMEQDWVKVLSEQLTRFLSAQAPNLGLRARDPSNPVRLLDYACASGGASWALSPFVDEILGVDIAPATVERFNECATRLGYSPTQAHAIAGDLSSDGSLVAEESFDVVIISMALHHLDDPQNMLNLLAKRLKPGGVLIAVEGVDHKSMAAGLETHEEGQAGSGGHGRKIHGHEVLKTTNRHLVFGKELFRDWFRDAGCDEDQFVYVEDEEVNHIPQEASGKAGGLDRKMVIASSMKEA